jgi:hypothetical protein
MALLIPAHCLLISRVRNWAIVTQGVKMARDPQQQIALRKGVANVGNLDLVEKARRTVHSILMTGYGCQNPYSKF